MCTAENIKLNGTLHTDTQSHRKNHKIFRIERTCRHHRRRRRRRRPPPPPTNKTMDNRANTLSAGTPSRPKNHTYFVILNYDRNIDNSKLKYRGKHQDIAD